MKASILVCALTGFLTSTVFASSNPILGSCELMEVEPILELQYVSHTCYRTEYESCNCDDQGCQTCSREVPYECGGDEWVRVGSKPLRPIEVHATLQPVKVGERAPDFEYAVGTKCSAEIDRGFTPESIANAVMKVPYLMGVIRAKQEIVEDSPSRLILKVSAEVVEADTKEIQSFLRKVKITSKNKLIFPQLKNIEYVSGSVCVGKDRWLSRGVKPFGCQSVASLRSGELKLTDINLKQQTRREWVYSLSFWAGKAASGVQFSKRW